MARDPDLFLSYVERIVVSSVAITARALSQVAPELTLLQWRVLVLADNGSSVSVGTLAEGLGAKLAATSRLVSRLRARGLIETNASKSDGRVVLVSLTGEGKALRNRVGRRRRGEIRASLSDFPVTETSIEAIDLLSNALERRA